MLTFASPFEKRVLERGFDKFIEKTDLLYKKQVPRKTIYREALILLKELKVSESNWKHRILYNEEFDPGSG